MTDTPSDAADFLLDTEDESQGSPILPADSAPIAPIEEDTPESAPLLEEQNLHLEQEQEPCAPHQQEEEPLQPTTANAVDLTPITQGLDDIMHRLSALSDVFTSKMRYDESKQTIIDRQHAELERYRQDEAFKLSKAIIMDVIAEVDSAEKNCRFYENMEETPENYAKLKKLVLGISDDLRDLLERNDIYAYRSEPGSPFNAKRQRVLKAIPTGDETLAKTIHESVRWGFEGADKVIRHELVNVYTYDPKLVAEPEETNTDTDSEQAPQQSGAEE